MNYLIIIFIRFYQQFISPYKGFRCAHAHLNQGLSCSHAVLKIVKQDGVWHGYRKIRFRIHACKQAYSAILAAEQEEKQEKKDKQYDCCDPSAACDIASCAGKGKNAGLPDLPCDCWS
jgi:putative component of membrane protein insertase Oxa1/YidC/SpoIIIJ protein YidD